MALLTLLVGIGIGWVAWGSAPTRNEPQSDPSGAQVDSAKAPRPNAADIGFAQDMTVHHNQALQMATFALGNSTDQQIHRLALQILTTQATEKGLMSGWLILWEAPELPAGPHMAWMKGMDHDTGGSAHAGHDATGTEQALMPGMATIGEITKLGSLKGTAFDILFLQLMIRHHTGGIEMAQAAAEQAATPAVRGLALEMARSQTQENAVMLAQLKELDAEPKF